MIEVKLTSWELMMGAMAGVMRQVENCKKGRRPAHGSGDSNDWQLHVEGALGELALAKAFGLYWSGKGIFRGPDVAGWQVRTRSKHHYDLILHETDPDDLVYWLVTGLNGAYRIHGHVVGSEGKRSEYWADPAGGRPAYFVPQKALSDEPPD